MIHSVKIKTWKKLLAAGLIIPAAFAFCLGAAADGTQNEANTVVIIDDGKIAPGVKLGGQDIGEMKGEEIADITQSVFDQNIDAYKLSLQYGSQQGELSAEELGIAADMDGTASQAMLVGRTGGVSERLKQRDEALAGEVDLGVKVGYDEKLLGTVAENYANSIPAEPTKEEVIFKPELEERFEFTERKDGFKTNVDEFKAMVLEAVQSGTFGTITMPGEVVKADGTPSDVIENTVLVSTFTTEYKGSSSNRIHNIKTAAEFLNGKVVQPDETISTNEVLGPRTSSKIWRPAPAIVNKTYKNQLGGGVCQVSTTLFNSVVMADLEIVQWVHHSWPSTYVDIGCDATISTGGPDFKFKNNTEWPIYIVAFADTDKKTVTVETWGRPLEDGTTIKLTGTKTGSTGIPGTPVVVTDPSDVSKGRAGQSSVTHKIYYDKDGNEIKKDVIDRHTYPAIAPRVLASSASSGGDESTPANSNNVVQGDITTT